MKTSFVALFVAVSLSSLSSLSGCKKIQEKMQQKAEERALETSSGGDVKVSSGGVTIKGKNGETVNAGTNATVPSDWPANVPVYPGATVTGSVVTPNAKTLVLETKDPIAKVHDFYKSKLSGMKSMMDMQTGNGSALQYQDGKTNVTVSLGGSPDKTNLTLNVSTAP